MTNEPIARAPSRRSLSAEIAEKLREAIVDARFDFGEALSEENLASVFRVSRTPVREALGLLEMEDLVVIVPRSGTYIYTPTPDEIAELCDYRLGLEIQGLRLSMARDRSVLHQRLMAIIAQMKSDVATQDIRSYGRQDTLYHFAFVGYAGNRYLERAYNMIIGRVASLRTQLAVRVAEEPFRSLEDHEAMAQLVLEGDLDGVAAILQTHVGRTKSLYIEAFRDYVPKTGPAIDWLRSRLEVMKR